MTQTILVKSANKNCLIGAQSMVILLIILIPSSLALISMAMERLTTTNLFAWLLKNKFELPGPKNEMPIAT